MSKIDWTKAKKEYVGDQTAKLAQLAKKYGVSETAMKSRAAKEGWKDLREKTLQKIDEKLPEKISESIAEYQARKFRDGQTMSELGIKVLTNDNTKIGSKTAAEMVSKGHEIQSQALGVEQAGSNVNVQVVIPILGGKTREET